MAVALKVPNVGESITEVEIGEWLKKNGDMVAENDPVVVIETEKATLEIPAPVSGKVTEVLKKTGEKAAVGEVIGYMESATVAMPDGKAANTPKPAEPEKKEPPKQEPPKQEPPKQDPPPREPPQQDPPQQEPPGQEPPPEPVTAPAASEAAADRAERIVPMSPIR